MMSLVKADSKKVMAVSADQFEDAEEEVVDLPYVKVEPASDTPWAGVPASAPLVIPDIQPKTLTPIPDASSKEAGKATFSTSSLKTIANKETPKVLRKTPVEKSHSTLRLPPPSKSVSLNPLDALASACVAEEQRKTATPKPPKEGSKISAAEISCTDVLCGRGGQSNHHPGNIFFRRLVRARQEEYLKANKREKTVVAKDIVKLIRMLSPPGRFLKKDPKNESLYVDVGDTQARNKASQALREGAPELRDELRDQHIRLNAQNGGGTEVKLPYQGNSKVTPADAEHKKDSEPRETMSEQEMAGWAARAARAASAQGLSRPPYGVIPGVLSGATGFRGKADPPDGSDDDQAETPLAVASSAAMHHAAAEERARRLMMAGAGPHGLGAGHLLHPHLGLGGLGGMNAFMAGHSPAAAAQLHAAALQAAGGSHFLSPQAFMIAAAAQQPSAAALYASRARELAHREFAGVAGINPMFLGGQTRAAAHGQYHEQRRLHEMITPGNVNGKRGREEIEREIDEKYAKNTKLTRQYL